MCRTLLHPEEQSGYYWSIRRLARYYLRAAQGLLDTVEHADQLLRRLQPRSSRTQLGMAPTDYHLHHRHAEPDPRTTPTTTESTTSTTSTSTAITTTTSEPASTSTTDPWDDFFDTTPRWLLEHPASGQASELPKTVIVRPDEDVVSSTEDDVSTPSATTEQSTTEGASTTLGK